MKNWVASVFSLILLFSSLTIWGKTAVVDSSKQALTQEILTYLSKIQADDHGSFPAGIFPSYRQYVYRPNVLKDDDNLFFTALILYTLKEIEPQLDSENKNLVAKIEKKALTAFPLYKNKNGGATYNFWRTHPPMIFPNSGWMNWFNRAQSLPDDFDDTALAMLAAEADAATVETLHNYMQQFANNKNKQIKNTLKPYRSIPAYSVWFGQRFPLDFDICVLANVLSMVSIYHLKWTETDSASLQLIKKMIETEDVIRNPNFISPHYQTTANILYHLGRLVANNDQALRDYKEKLIQWTKKEIETTQSPMEKVILATTLTRLGAASQSLIEFDSFEGILSRYAFDNFNFFIANMSSMLPNPLKAPLSKKGIGKFNYYCPSYNLALVLEQMYQQK